MDEIDKKWNIIDTVIDETELHRRMNILPEPARRQMQESQNKLTRIKTLKNNVDIDQLDFKRELLMLMHERNVYLEKLYMIRELGERMGWHSNDGMLQELQFVVHETLQALRRSVS